MASQPDDFLAEAVREAERVQDLELGAMTEWDNRTQTLITLASAALAGGFALGAFLGGTLCASDRLLLLLPAIGGVASLIAMVLFVQSYTGIWSKHIYYATPSTKDLLNKAKDDSWSLDHHRSAFLLAAAKASTKNDELLNTAGRFRRYGLIALVVAAGSYSIAGFAYLLGLILFLKC